MESRASDQLTVSVIPPELRKAVQESGKDQYWASTVIPVGTEDRPGIAVGNKVTFNGTVYELYLIYDLNTAQQTLDEIQSVLWAGGAVLVLMIGAIAWYVTRNVVSPVSHAADGLRKTRGRPAAGADGGQGRGRGGPPRRLLQPHGGQPPGADHPAGHPVPDAAALRLGRLP